MCSVLSPAQSCTVLHVEILSVSVQQQCQDTGHCCCTSQKSSRPPAYFPSSDMYSGTPRLPHCPTFTTSSMQTLTVHMFLFSSRTSVHTGTLLANMVGCLAWFCVDASRGVDFGLSILWFMLFTPCSFVCWYRPLYGAFR